MQRKLVGVPSTFGRHCRLSNALLENLIAIEMWFNIQAKKIHSVFHLYV